ncbi:Uncharacterised protein [Halioglobus japonicus]|nr:Uncharacterised protein [Halioglobus japonicus]
MVEWDPYFQGYVERRYLTTHYHYVNEVVCEEESREYPYSYVDYQEFNPNAVDIAIATEPLFHGTGTLDNADVNITQQALEDLLGVEVGYVVSGMILAPPARPVFFPEPLSDTPQLPSSLELPSVTKIPKAGVLGRIIVVLQAILHSPEAGDPDADKEFEALDYGVVQALHNTLNQDGTGENKAMIGEDQEERVDPQARLDGAITISNSAWGIYWFIGGTDTDLKKRLQMAYNKGWLNGIMLASYTIIDIGRDADKQPPVVSCFYQMERRHIVATGYLLYEQKDVPSTYDFNFEGACQF